MKPTTRQRAKQRLFLDLQPYLSSFREEGLSLRQIVARLNGWEIPSYSGKTWNLRSVSEAVASLNSKNAGQKQ